MFWQLKRQSPKGLLLKSARAGNLRQARKAIASGAPPDTRDGHGRTALCLAVKNNRHEMVRFLIESGADVNFKLAYGRTPIYHAIHYGSLETLGLLLEAGADPTVKDATGQTPYEYAKSHYKSQMAAMLKQESDTE